MPNIKDAHIKFSYSPVHIPDVCEQISDVLLHPLRMTYGYTFCKLHMEYNRSVKKINTVGTSILWKAVFFTVGMPITLLGVAFQSCSKSFEEGKQKLKWLSQHPFEGFGDTFYADLKETDKIEWYEIEKAKKIEEENKRIEEAKKNIEVEANPLIPLIPPPQSPKTHVLSEEGVDSDSDENDPPSVKTPLSTKTAKLSPVMSDSEGEEESDTDSPVKGDPKTPIPVPVRGVNPLRGSPQKNLLKTPTPSPSGRRFTLPRVTPNVGGTSAKKLTSLSEEELSSGAKQNKLKTPSPNQTTPVKALTATPKSTTTPKRPSHKLTPKTPLTLLKDPIKATPKIEPQPKLTKEEELKEKALKNLKDISREDCVVLGEFLKKDQVGLEEIIETNFEVVKDEGAKEEVHRDKNYSTLIENLRTLTINSPREKLIEKVFLFLNECGDFNLHKIVSNLTPKELENVVAKIKDEATDEFAADNLLEQIKSNQVNIFEQLKGLPVRKLSFFIDDIAAYCNKLLCKDITTEDLSKLAEYESGEEHERFLNDLVRLDAHFVGGILLKTNNLLDDVLRYNKYDWRLKKWDEKNKASKHKIVEFITSILKGSTLSGAELINNITLNEIRDHRLHLIACSSALLIVQNEELEEDLKSSELIKLIESLNIKNSSDVYIQTFARELAGVCKPEDIRFLLSLYEKDQFSHKLYVFVSSFIESCFVNGEAWLEKIAPICASLKTILKGKEESLELVGMQFQYINSTKVLSEIVKNIPADLEGKHKITLRAWLKDGGTITRDKIKHTIKVSLTKEQVESVFKK